MTFKEFWQKVVEFMKSAFSWLGTDGMLHMCVSALIMLALGWIRPLWIAAVITLCIGIAKEIYDFFRDGKVITENSAHDFCCDIAGILIGLLLVMLNNLR